jgi:hypothetical protein
MSRDFSSMGVVAQKQSSENSVDYDAIKKAIRETQEKKVKALNAETEQTVVGVIASINYVGKHEMKGKAEITSDDHLKELLVKTPDLQVITENGKRFYEFDQKVAGYVQVSVDIPDAIVDYGGEIGVKPMRITMNGERWLPTLKAMVVNNPYPTKETTKDFGDKIWSLGKKTGLYKLAVATGVVTTNDPFTSNEVGKLLGKAAMFTVCAKFNEKGYYNEYIKNAAPLMRGLPVPKYDTSLLSMVVGFNYADGQVLESDVQVLSKATANSIFYSQDYKGSRLEKDFGAIISKKVGGQQNQSTAAAATDAPQTNNAVSVDKQDEELSSVFEAASADVGDASDAALFV